MQKIAIHIPELYGLVSFLGRSLEVSAEHQIKGEIGVIDGPF